MGPFEKASKEVKVMLTSSGMILQLCGSIAAYEDVYVDADDDVTEDDDDDGASLPLTNIKDCCFCCGGGLGRFFAFCFFIILEALEEA